VSAAFPQPQDTRQASSRSALGALVASAWQDGQPRWQAALLSSLLARPARPEHVFRQDGASQSCQRNSSEIGDLDARPKGEKRAKKESGKESTKSQNNRQFSPSTPLHSQTHSLPVTTKWQVFVPPKRQLKISQARRKWPQNGQAHLARLLSARLTGIRAFLAAWDCSPEFFSSKTCLQLPLELPQTAFKCAQTDQLGSDICFLSPSHFPSRQVGPSLSFSALPESPAAPKWRPPAATHCAPGLGARRV